MLFNLKKKQTKAKFYILLTQCIYEFFFWILEQTQIIYPYTISLLVFKNELGCVYCTV
jgi:hypothetical protein